MRGYSVEESSPVSATEMEKPYFVRPPYQAYVDSLCSHNPSLLNLSAFLARPHHQQSGCRIAALDFHTGVNYPIIRNDLEIHSLLTETQTWSPDGFGYNGGDKALHGRMLIIEDLTRDVIELVGSALDIDPLFFAMHLHTAERSGMRHQTPDEATLPSRLLPEDYINISYHRTVTCSQDASKGGKILRDTTIDRKLVFLRSTSIGLAQHCASVIRIRRRNGFWIALVLVDPPMTDTYYPEGKKRDMQHKITLHTQPYLGAYEDFLGPSPFSSDVSYPQNAIRGSIFQDLQYYWARKYPDCFEVYDPSLESLAYYPLKIVAAEWVKYVAVMQYCIKRYEYQNESLPALDRINHDLRELQGWRRRSMLSQSKVQSVIRQLGAKSSSTMGASKDLQYLIGDFDYINSNIESAGRRLENMLPVVMTLVQIADTRRSFAETADINRLTVLALVFVPLTFVASLFSMNDQNSPGSKEFWVYFAVAIPVTLLVIIVARPPKRVVWRVLEWVKGLKSRPKPQRTNSEKSAARGQEA